MRVLFVCLGNICRSPTAEGVMRKLVSDAGLDDRIEIDSAGTGSWHVGAKPDPRAAAAALKVGFELGGRARQVTAEDFERFDMILAMDRFNASELLGMAPGGAGAEKVRLLREFDPASSSEWNLDVPDPYEGGEKGFRHALELIEAACRGLIEDLRRREPVG
ncbi:MAG TPA: low molecular weight protein-tyrosine-phosphatase [Solirubrobacteraceae bacterium]|nr:low molecular weight protein-tyrosine-phosphatase [Solirubrobacteraceae bacterium]